MSNTDKLREIAKKYFPTEEKLSNNSLYNQLQQSSQDNLLSDLTAILEQHKEVMMEFVKWIGFHSATLYYRDVDEKWLMTRRDFEGNPIEEYDEYNTAELFDYWIKNVKK